MHTRFLGARYVNTRQYSRALRWLFIGESLVNIAVEVGRTDKQLEALVCLPVGPRILPEYFERCIGCLTHKGPVQLQLSRLQLYYKSVIIIGLRLPCVWADMLTSMLSTIAKTFIFPQKGPLPLYKALFIFA